MTHSLDDVQTLEAATLLYQATRDARAIERLSSRYPDLTLADAYRVQHAGRGLRERAGARWIGWKMGLTSIAKREQMNLDSAIWGYLHDRGLVRDRFALTGLIHAKIEPEIGFRLKRPLKGRVSFGEAMDAIGSVALALEIIDSRYVGFKYFSLPDVVADNCSAGLFAWGPELEDFRGLKLDEVPLRMSVDGVVAHEARGAEISGHPVHSLMQLSEMLEAAGEMVPAGAYVLAGAATTAVALAPGQTVALEGAGLPTLTVSVT